MELKLFTHENPIGYEISTALNSGNYHYFKMAVAYAKNSGVGRLYEDLNNFSRIGGVTEAIIGIDQNITSYQALLNLSTLVGSNLYIHHDRGSISFHPKVYLFGNTVIEKVFIGSSNLTSGGLYLNLEANVSLELDYTQIATDFRQQVTNYWNNLISDANTKKADIDFINEMLKLGTVIDENQIKPFRELISKISKIPFGSKRQGPLPPLSPAISISPPTLSQNFAMLLSGFDVSPKSLDPVILIPVRALRELPTFWNWPYMYTLSGTGYPELYTHATIVINGKMIPNFSIRIYYYDAKSEFRLQCEPIKRNGNQGDIILITKDSQKPLEFRIELIRKGSLQHNTLLTSLTQKVSKFKSYSYL
ncbi:MAG: phospholipase D family protein [Anaerolineales bacterium]|nr:phospholipase D family protein [Anaerolineales bacterium]